MKLSIALLAVVLSIFVSFVLSENIFTPSRDLSEKEFQDLFIRFSRVHEKLYASQDEHNHRYQIFRKNVERVITYNKQSEEANYGVTKFMDLTPEEFKRTYLMKSLTPSQAASAMFGGNKVHDSKQKIMKDAPESFDWREKNAVSPVKNQGQCGSCWAFSTTGNLEGQNYIKNGKMVTLSEQNLVDCDNHCVQYEGQKTCDSGCNGGLMWSAMQYIISNGGIDTEESYPYEGVDGQCRFKKEDIGVKLSNWTWAPTQKADQDEMAAFLANNGPIAIAINAEWLQFYFGGISDPWWCSPTSLDHGVLIVGYGVDGKKPYWIIKNSWGASWGEKGYFRIIKSSGTDGKCGINQVPVSGVLA